MKKLGKIVTVKDGKAILKTKEPVKKGKKVYDESKRFIGNVIGFKDEEYGEYAIISPKKKPDSLMGEKVYGWIYPYTPQFSLNHSRSTLK